MDAKDVKIGMKVRRIEYDSPPDVMVGGVYIVSEILRNGWIRVAESTQDLALGYFEPWNISFDEYQDETSRTDATKDGSFSDKLQMSALGLAGEAGEFVELVKKHVYHGKEIDREKAAKELGDVLWYIARAANAMGYSLSDIAQGNLDKLRKRYETGFSAAASEARVDVKEDESILSDENKIYAAVMSRLTSQQVRAVMEAGK